MSCYVLIFLKCSALLAINIISTTLLSVSQDNLYNIQYYISLGKELNFVDGDNFHPHPCLSIDKLVSSDEEFI